MQNVEYWQTVISQSVEKIADDGLLECDAEDVAAMVGAACNTWLFQDIEQTTVESIEHKFNVPIGFWSIYGTTDLVLVNRDGRRLVRDWKTAGKIDELKRAQYRLSWQHKVYLWATQADEFQYRLVQKPDARNPTYGLGVAEVNYVVQDRRKLNEEVERQLDAVTQAIAAQGYTGPWAMNIPFACGAYNRPCPFVHSCGAQGGTPPVEQPAYRTLNNSGMNTFMLCPERYRQTLLAQPDSMSHANVDSSGATEMGKSFHAAMERIYRAVQHFHSERTSNEIERAA